MTNVVRHAHATEVELRLERADDRVNLVVRDDGEGLPQGALPSAHGIRGMRERAMLIGADIAITRRSDRGTEVELSIPVEAGR